jgi:hypothetical protein
MSYFMKKHELELHMQGGTFVPENRGEKGVFASTEFTPEIAEEEQMMRDREAKEVYGGPFVTIEDGGSIFENDDDLWEDQRFDVSEPVVMAGWLTFEKVLATENNGHRAADLAGLLCKRPGLIAGAYEFCRQNNIYSILNALPGMVAGIVEIRGRSVVIAELVGQDFDVDGNLNALTELRNFAKAEIRRQESPSGFAERGIACGILNLIGY